MYTFTLDIYIWHLYTFTLDFVRVALDFVLCVVASFLSSKIAVVGPAQHATMNKAKSGQVFSMLV